MEYYVEKQQENFLTLLKENASKDKDGVCFTFYDYSKEERVIKLTRTDLIKKSLPVAAMLKEKGAQKGDRVVIFSSQTADNILSVIGSILAGTIFTIIPLPIGHNKKMRFLSVLEACKPKFILCGDAFEGELQTVLKELKNDKKILPLIEHICLINVEKCTSTEKFVQENIGLEDIIYIQYSSGSTSAPKGVMVSYGNLLSAINSTLKSAQSKRIFGWIPFFHNLGLVYLIFTPIIKLEVSAGIMSPEAFLEKPLRWFEGMSKFKADVTMAPNSVFDTYPKLVPANKVNEIDLSNLKTLINGSEIVNYGTMKRFSQEYKELGININMFLIGYGLAEATCGISCGAQYSEKQRMIIDFEKYQAGKLALADENTKDSIEFIGNGKIVDIVKVKVVNPTTLEECAEDEFGELWVQGPCVAKGYYKNEKATEETFNGKLKNYTESFLRTGDLGIIKDGYLYVTGRIKELIIINGVNIMPNDIAVKLKACIPELKDANIVPFSIVKEDKERLIIVSEILGKCKELKNLSNKINKYISKYFEVSAYYIGFVSEGELPRADNGKISIRKTANLYKDGKLNLIKSEEACSEEKCNKYIKYNTEIEKALGNIIEEKLSYKASNEENLLNLGMDSLQVLELTTTIENVFNVNIPVAFIFENPTIEKIAKYIDKTLKGEDVSLLEKDKTYLYDEVKLDENIKAKKYEDENPPMKNVFITGTTGFVGAYLIKTLIAETKAKLYCHVRAKDKEAGFKRLKENLEYYKLWKEEYKEYITPVLGHLEKPLLGIEKEEYKWLTEIIDTVFHNGAILNFVYPYERLKPTNVLGTVETIKFSCEGKQKYYNYISSYSVFDNPSYFNKTVAEDDALEKCTGYFLPYSESKWVSEKIVRLARQRGLRAAIYRPGEITGDNKNGIWKYGDSVTRTIKAMLQTRTYPDIDMKIHMTQVDYIAEAIIYISKQGEAYKRAYNLLNSVSISIRELGKIINECGYETKAIDYAIWKENLFKAGSEHPLKLLESLFKTVKKHPRENIESRYSEMSPILQTSNTDKALIGTNIKCEPISRELISKYLKNFI